MNGFASLETPQDLLAKLRHDRALTGRERQRTAQSSSCNASTTTRSPANTTVDTRRIASTGWKRACAMLGEARRTAPTALLVRGAAEQLPWADDSFDRVLCVNALHHFQHHRRVFAECARELRAGGAFLTIGLEPHAAPIRGGSTSISPPRWSRIAGAILPPRQFARSCPSPDSERRRLTWPSIFPPRCRSVRRLPRVSWIDPAHRNSW